MRVHHLNCATMRPPLGRLVNGTGGLFDAGHMVCHCLLVETDDGLVLVDTGLGREDVADPARRLGKDFVRLVRPALDDAETALTQIGRLGHRAADVRHIVVTHLDLDHAGALSDFPAAQVHVYDAEYAAATAPATFLERRRYRKAQWAHGPAWVRHTVRGERWHGFDAVTQLAGLAPELLLVPLHGHSRGHCGVAVQTPAGWLLHAGDAYFHRDEVHAPTRRCPGALDVFQRVVQIDGPTRVANQTRLRALAADHGSTVAIFSAHDPAEFARFA